ncbi:hypothetical protein [Helicobacter sp. L8]|uniref:hypothetical protein n=1 Tax=Helicobacter sp. L8 TaxID=2316078 RepID=UPI000EACB553|nr:hypothetical protein [Helicobacter sp. L8]
MGFGEYLFHAFKNGEVVKKVGMHPNSYQQESKPPKFEQYKAEIEAVKKRVEEKQVAFNALQKPQKG